MPAEAFDSFEKLPVTLLGSARKYLMLVRLITFWSHQQQAASEGVLRYKFRSSYEPLLRQSYGSADKFKLIEMLYVPT